VFLQNNFYFDIFLHSNFDCMKIVSGNTSRARALKAICTGTEWLRKVKSCVDGIAYLQIDISYCVVKVELTVL
jgi:hypothetical protein